MSDGSHDHLPGRHRAPGGRSLLPDEPVGTEARAALREWWQCHRADFSPPRIESLRKLDLQCEVARDREFWQLVRAAAEEELGSLNDRRHDWRQATPFETADDAIADEVNLMLVRVCGPDESKVQSRESREERTMPPAAVARRTKAPKSTKPKPAKPAAVDTSTTAKPELSESLMRIDIDQLHPSPYQTRRPPSQERLIELGNLLVQQGQLTPCLVRPLPAVEGFELIGGHTRTAAAKALGWHQMLCRLVECDDATARRLVLIDNVSHEGLTIIEQAQALQGLVDDYAAAGRSQRQLAVDIGLPQSEISNLVRMLKLPEVWQERVITEEISKTQARELLPWVDVPDLWPVLERTREDDDGLTFSQLLHEALHDVSRPLAGSWYDETRSRWSVVAFKPSPDERKALDCRKVDGVERAFAWQLWESMQHVAEDKAAKKASKQVEATEGQVAAGKLDPKEAAERHNKRLYRWRVAWLQRRVSDALAAMDVVDLLPVLLAWFAMRGSEGVQERRSELAGICGLKAKQSWHGVDPLEIVAKLLTLKSPERSSVLRSAIQLWVLHSIEGWNTDMPPAFVERLAEHLGIDIVRQWSNDRAYLELLTTAQLQELAAEWKLKPAATKRGELVEWLANAGREKPCPKAVRGIKAVALH